MVDRNKWSVGHVWLVIVFLSEWVYKGYLVLKQHDFLPRLDKKQLTNASFIPHLALLLAFWWACSRFLKGKFRWIVVQGFTIGIPILWFTVYLWMEIGLLRIIKNIKMSRQQQDTQYSGSLSEKPKGLHLHFSVRTASQFGWKIQFWLVNVRPVWTVSLGRERWNGKNFSLFL